VRRSRQLRFPSLTTQIGNIWYFFTKNSLSAGIDVVYSAQPHDSWFGADFTMVSGKTSKRNAVDPMLQSLVNSHSEPFALVDRDFNVVACNQKYAEIYLGKDCSKAICK
jgi:PAS domain-containing protein